jgi:hypothetical protein
MSCSSSQPPRTCPASGNAKSDVTLANRDKGGDLHDDLLVDPRVIHGLRRIVQPRPQSSGLRAAVTPRRHLRCVVVVSHPGGAAGSRSFPGCSTRNSHTFCLTSS